jgi:Predicted flavoprotein involved in K+ transport
MKQIFNYSTGHLADEHLPQIPGLEEFQGQVMHSARWNHEVIWIISVWLS